MRALLFVLLIIPSFTFAQSLDTTFSELAKELATLQSELQAASQGSQKFTNVGWGIGAAESVTVTATEAGVYSGAASDAKLITTLSAGVNLPVLDKAGEWYAVGFEEQEAGFQGGWMKAADVIPAVESTMYSSQTLAERAYDQVLEKVRKLKEKYDDNPHVRVTGFNIDISIPPALSIGFEFK